MRRRNSLFTDPDDAEEYNPRAAGKTRALKNKVGIPTSPRWWEEAEEVPRAGLPDAKTLSKKQRRYRWWVWTSLVLTPFLILTTIVLMANVLTGDDSGRSVARDPYTQTKSDAIVEVRRWLGSNPSPLPGGVLIGWDSATSERVPGDQDASGYDVEVHHLTVASPNGQLYDTTVALGVSEELGAVKLGDPALMARAPSATSHEGEIWPGLDSTAAPESVSSAVESWAQAYSSGDPNGLRIAIQDTDPSHSYMPLVGASLSDMATMDSAAIWPADVTPEEMEGLPETMIVQADFAIQWASAPTPESSRPARVTYDLLIHKADTAAPVVVAWGGPGMGPRLNAYDNAIDGREIDPVDGFSEVSE